ncbi:MAG: SDR family NAD(P)-dependent oxidoreductase [Casimicrobiaceae bacterium]
MDIQSLAAKVVLVAGGTGGLGAAISRAFIATGARVIVTWRHAGEFAALRQAAGGDAERLEGQAADVTDEAAAIALVAGIRARHARLDVVVNAVGGYAGGAALWDADAAVLPRMLSLNLYAAHALARASIPSMREAAAGAFINIAAKSGIDHPAGAGAYAASKAAAIALMDSLAADLGGSGVRVNSVLPSIIDTDANRRTMPNADYAKWPKPDDIARVVVFLASDEARVIHGASIPVYGNG